MKEANYFALAANFFWTLWAIHMATSTAIKFGYMVEIHIRTDANVGLDCELPLVARKLILFPSDRAKSED